MRPKSLILLALALTCGLAAAIGINQVLANRPVDQAPDMGETVPIFVALMDIGLGDPLTPQVLKLEEWPKMKVPPGALLHLEDVEGRRARTKFYAGEPIIEAKLFAKGDQGSGATDLIPKGFRVVSVKVDDVSGSGLILPGDRVDALVHLADNSAAAGSEGNRSSTHTFLQNVKVFAVNNVYSREANGTEAITAKTISLLVTPQQAELVTLANEMGKIRLVMRSADDEAHDETGGVTQSELFTGGDHATSHKQAAAETLMKIIEPAKPKEPPPEEPAAPPTNVWKMVVIKGDAVDEVEFEDGDRVGGPIQVRQLSAGVGSTSAGASGTLPLGATTTTTSTPPYTPAPGDGP
ncbi:MAG TPA: Flp pilus assembly protein CpaB [Pirellulales bacterium]|nr:Flp pilus assembly protein CpaB [Pirellulales bacterium]